MIKILGIVLLCCLIFACLEFLLDHLLYTLIGVAVIYALVKIKNTFFPKKVYVESEEEKRERELARKEALMEQFYKLEPRAKSKTYIACYGEELDCLEELAQLGHVPAMMLLGTHKAGYISYKYYMMASNAGEYQGAVYAYWRFLALYFESSTPDDYNMKAVCEGLRKGAESGNAECMFALSLCYAKGWVESMVSVNAVSYMKSPFDPNQEKMFFWLKKAFDQGCTNPGVQVMMAEYYATGKIWINENFDKDPAYISKENCIDQKKAFELVEAVLQCDWPERTRLSPIPVGRWLSIAKYFLTMFYFDGYGTKQNVEKARSSFLYFTGKKEGTLEVSVKDHSRLSALRKELKEAHNIEYNKLLDKMITDFENNLSQNIE